jgi:hypothetical protein
MSDIIAIGGGGFFTKYILDVLGGQSAGAICWFEQGITDSWADRRRPLEVVLLPRL